MSSQNSCGVVALVVASVLCLVSQPVLAGLFATPIGGIPFTDWSIGNYVDLDPGSGVLDYAGGNYTYDGHDAIDFGIDTFANMDKGVPVLAAAAGTVTSVVDGHYDRNYSGHIIDYNANYVTISHGGGLTTSYYHLMKDSIDVSVGQIVSQGQQLGLVGSSGNSSGPHLHFAVKENGNTIETYENPRYWWNSPLPYSGHVPCSLAWGIADHGPADFNEITLGPEVVKVFMGGDVPTMWLTLHGIKDDDLDFYFLRPDGSTQAHWHWLVSDINSGWWCANIGLPSNPMLGTWTVDVRLNGYPFVSDTFQVVSSLVPGDANRDGVVDEKDASTLAYHWGQSGGWSDGDFNTDGVVNAADASILAANWGYGSAEATGVPEPTTLAMVIAGFVLIAARRQFVGTRYVRPTSFISPSRVPRR